MSNNKNIITYDDLRLNYFLWNEGLITTDAFEEAKKRYWAQEYARAASDPFEFLSGREAA